MSEMTDYPTIDVMNHLLEVRAGMAGNPFQFREFQIMLETTFKAMGKPRAPKPDGDEADGKKKRSSGRANRHAAQYSMRCSAVQAGLVGLVGRCRDHADRPLLYS